MSWIPLAIDMARQRHYSSPQLMGGRFIASSPHGENEIKEKKRHRNAYQFQSMHYQATPTIKSDRPELRRRHPPHTKTPPRRNAVQPIFFHTPLNVLLCGK